MTKGRKNKIDKVFEEIKKESGPFFARILEKQNDTDVVSDYFFIIFSTHLDEIEEEYLKVNYFNDEFSEKHEKYLNDYRKTAEERMNNFNNYFYKDITYVKNDLIERSKERVKKSINKIFLESEEEKITIKHNSLKNMLILLDFEKNDIVKISVAPFIKDGFILKIEFENSDYGYIVAEKDKD